MTDFEHDAIPKLRATHLKAVLILCALVITFSLLAAPLFIRKSKCRGQTEETSNLRQIGLALFEFEAEYGRYPDEASASAVTAKNPNHSFDLSGNSSNAFFRQLFAANLTQTESIFYAKSKDSRKPDGNIYHGHALEKGEVAFGYISGLSTKGNPARIIAFAPIIPGTTKFDPKPFDGMAVALRIDNSVTSLKIHKDGQIKDIDGNNLLSPTHPIWEGEPFKIHCPE